MTSAWMLGAEAGGSPGGPRLHEQFPQLGLIDGGESHQYARMTPVVLGGEELVGLGAEKSLPVLDAGAPGYEDSRLLVNSGKELVLEPISGVP